MNILYYDCETHSKVNLTSCGVYNYHSDSTTFNTMVQWAINDAPVQIWMPGDEIPQDIIEHINSRGYTVAHNAAFDRLHWQYVLTPEYGWPALSDKQVLCSSVQAQAHALPPALGQLSSMLNLKKQKSKIKAKNGKSIVKAYLTSAPTDADDLAAMKHYGVLDVEAMREIWKGTRVLSGEEWSGYHDSEDINDRGIPIDAELAALCMQAGDKLAQACSKEFYKLTGLGVNQTSKIATWLSVEAANTSALGQLTEMVEVDGESVAKIRIGAEYRGRALACSDTPENVEDVLHVLDIAKSSTAKKYARFVNTGMDGRVYGAYMYNGAGQSGRFSSRGVQMHNMYRGCFTEQEVPAAKSRIKDFLVDDRGYDELMLAHPLITHDIKAMVRPVVCAPEGKRLVWGDWSGIEARICPWMAQSRSADKVLNLFESGADVYKHIASDIYHKPVDEITKDERQIGKIAQLSLQFSAGVGALFNMAAGYGVKMTEEEAKDIVVKWRASNPWARLLADKLWNGAKQAFNAPGVRVDVGRVSYIYQSKLLGGSLLCILPCGRPITYPRARFRVETTDDWTREVLRTATGMLWAGTLVNNVVQGTAASVLRHAIAQDALQEQIVVAHTHDELIMEVDAEDVEWANSYLHGIMTALPEWLDLKIPVEIDHGKRYGK